jgi:enoyl-CoA hydratase
VMPKKFDTLETDIVDQHILLITLNRPDAANAMNTQMGLDLFNLFSELTFDPADYRCVVLTGKGKAFCAGGDLKERRGMDDEVWRKQHVVFEQAVYTIMDCPLPTICAVNGAAFGGGCELALACDFIFGCELSRFALTETRLGIIPGAGGTQNLPRTVGLRRAKQIIFTATPFSAAEALEWGLLNTIYAASDLVPEVLNIARRISENGPIAVRQAKRAMQIGYGVDLKTALALEIEAYNRTVPTEDRREGVHAFNEKRQPVFKGK